MNQPTLYDLPELIYPPVVKALVDREDSFTQQCDALYAVYEDQCPPDARLFVRRARREIVALVAELEREADNIASLLLDEEDE